MSVLGTWTAHWSWACTGEYAEIAITFKNDGTFTSPSGHSGGFSGLWWQKGGQIILYWDGGYKPIWSGAVQGGAMVGMIADPSNPPPSTPTGCWYAVASGGTAFLLKKQTAEEQQRGPDGSYPLK